MGGTISSSTVSASAAVTATGVSAAFRISDNTKNVALLVDVTAVSGVTPTCTFSVEWSHNGTTFAIADAADSYAAITTTAVRVKQFSVKGEWLRLRWTVTGTTPSFTFATTAHGV